MNTKSVTVTRTTIIDGEIVDIFEIACADARVSKAAIRLALGNASAEGYEVEFTSRQDAVAVLAVPSLGYRETISWVAEFDARKSAKWSPTMAQYKLAGRHNQELCDLGLLEG